MAGILLPVLSRAREAAIDTSCRNHLHQDGLAFNMYTGDFRNYLPPGGCEDLPSRLYYVGTTFNGYPMPADVRGLGDYLGNTRTMMCPGFDQGVWLNQPNVRAYFFPWFGKDVNYWRTAPTGYPDANNIFLGYLYLKSSHGPLMWEQRYGSLQGTIAYRIDGRYPVAAAYGGPVQAQKLLVLLADQAYTTSFYAGWNTPVLATPVDWDNFPHRPSRPRSGNCLRPDGHVDHKPASVWRSWYNGWAIMDWGEMEQTP